MNAAVDKKIKVKERNIMASEERKVGEGIGFERIRRITGYLVGTTERFNNGKRAEERDRVKHGTQGILTSEENED